MSRWLKVIVLFVIGVVSFILFLYWMFPYDAIKDKVENAVESRLGAGYELTIEKLRPSFVTGIVLKNVVLKKRNSTELVPILEIEKAKARISLLSMLFGGDKVRFYIYQKDGKVSGYFKKISEGLNVVINIDEYNLKDVPFFKYNFGLNLESELNGSINLALNYSKVTGTNGAVDIELSKFKILPSNFRLGMQDTAGALEIPEIDITRDDPAKIKFNIKNGALDVEKFQFAKGDLELSLDGKIYLSSFLKNYRMNINGDLKFSDKIQKALPVLFIIEKQKDEKGNYPLRITGRMASPTIKIGTFTLPI